MCLSLRLMALRLNVFIFEAECVYLLNVFIFEVEYL